MNQREVLGDIHGFATALKSALREDPDVVSRRDARPGDHRVGADDRGDRPPGLRHAAYEPAAQTINRIIDVFPAHQQEQIRTQLSIVLQAIVASRCCPGRGGGRVVAVEVLIATPAIRNLIRDDKVHQIYSSMQAGQEKVGTQTLNQALASLYYAGAITLEAARQTSSLRAELADMISRGVGVVPGAGMGRDAGAPHGRRPGDHGERQ